jgi:hypothetical protein
MEIARKDYMDYRLRRIPVFDTFDEIDRNIYDLDTIDWIFNPEGFGGGNTDTPVKKIGNVTIDSTNYNDLDTFDGHNWNAGKPGLHTSIVRNRWLGGSGYFKTFYSDIPGTYNYAIRITKEDARQAIIEADAEELFKKFQELR